MRPPVMLIADDPALDFLNTIGAPRGEMIEWLQTGGDLKNWLVQAGLVPAQALGVAPGDAALQTTVAEARALRESFRAYLETGAPEVLDRLNAILRRERSFWRLGPDAPPELVRVQDFSAPEQLLVPVAVCMAELIVRDETRRVRQCAGPTCTMWFRDVSRNNRRRWCSMAVCGNRAKAAAHRARTRPGSE